MSEAPLLYAAEDGVARITLNRPDKLNSFNLELHAEMTKVLKSVRKDEKVRALLLTGSGRGFAQDRILLNVTYLLTPGHQIWVNLLKSVTTPWCAL